MNKVEAEKLITHRKANGSEFQQGSLGSRPEKADVKPQWM